MKNQASLLIITIFTLFGTSDVFASSRSELNRAKEQMIQESINSYSGNCPCPYNSMRNGRSCGGRSAYTRPRGAAPLCYPKDISDEEAERHLKKN